VYHHCQREADLSVRKKRWRRRRKRGELRDGEEKRRLTRLFLSQLKMEQMDKVSISRAEPSIFNNQFQNLTC